MLSDKLLDALIREMEDIVREMTKRAIGRLPSRLVRPGSPALTPSHREIRQAASGWDTVN